MECNYLTNSQYEEIFQAAIGPNLSQSLPEDNSPHVAKSPKELDFKPMESASVENSQSRDKTNTTNSCKTVLKTPDILSKKEKLYLERSSSNSRSSSVNRTATHTNEKHKEKKIKLSKKVDKDISLHEALNILKETNTESSLNESFSLELYENQLSQPADNLTHKERLEWLQKRRVVGLWVFCDKPSCNKQRWLENVYDPTELPDKWYCDMNPNKKFNKCSIFEKGPSVQEDNDLICNIYTCGSVVWGRVAGYPWWPAMVDDDPDTEQYYWLDGYSDIPTYYHVVFFNTGQVSRAWLTPSALCAYKNNPNLDRKCKNIQNYRFQLDFSKKQAENALKLNLKERLATYSFLAQWPGKIRSPTGTKNIKCSKNGKKKSLQKTSTEKNLEKNVKKSCELEEKLNSKKVAVKDKVSSNENPVLRCLLSLVDSDSDEYLKTPQENSTEKTSETQKEFSIELNFNDTKNNSESKKIDSEDLIIKNKIENYSKKMFHKSLKKTTQKNFSKNSSPWKLLEINISSEDSSKKESKANSRGYEADSETSHLSKDSKTEYIFGELKKDVQKYQDNKRKKTSEEKAKKLPTQNTVNKPRSLGLRRIKKPNRKENFDPHSSHFSDTESICSNISTIKVKSLGLSQPKVVNNHLKHSDSESIISVAQK